MNLFKLLAAQDVDDYSKSVTIGIDVFKRFYRQRLISCVFVYFIH